MIITCCVEAHPYEEFEYNSCVPGENLKFTTFKYLCTRTVKTDVDFYTKCNVLLVANDISRVLECFKSRYYSCVQVKDDHVQALVPERSRPNVH